MRNTRRGFASLSALFAVSIALLLSAFLCSFAQDEAAMAKNFLKGVKARECAEAGIQDFIAKVSKKEEFVEKARLAARQGEIFVQSKKTAAENSYTVYLSAADGQWILLSIGSCGGVRRQIVAYLQFDASSRTFSILRLDNT